MDPLAVCGREMVDELSDFFLGFLAEMFSDIKLGNGLIEQGAYGALNAPPERLYLGCSGKSASIKIEPSLAARASSRQ